MIYPPSKRPARPYFIEGHDRAARDIGMERARVAIKPRIFGGNRDCDETGWATFGTGHGDGEVGPIDLIRD